MDSKIKFYLSFLTVCSVVFIGTHLLHSDQYSLKSDEGYYYKYVTAFAKDGFSCFTNLINEYEHNPKDLWYPPPTRVGYSIPLGCAYRFYPSVNLLGIFSFFCFILSLWVNLHFSKKVFKDKISAYALTALLASSPLLMGLSRRALIDSFVFLLSISILWLCTDYVLNKNKKQLGFICLMFIWALLAKEGSFLFLPFILISCWLAREESAWPLKPWLFVCFSAFLGAWFIPGVIFSFHFGINLHIISLINQAVFINPYLIHYCQGPWFRYIVDGILLSPIVALLAIGYGGYALLQRDYLRITGLWFIFYITVYCSLLVYQKNVRYAASLEAVYCLFAFLALSYSVYCKEPSCPPDR